MTMLALEERTTDDVGLLLVVVTVNGNPGITYLLIIS